ncbi:MAG: hypothetical protein WDO68_16890 [Gammaproteobacteria bacterium]
MKPKRNDISARAALDGTGGRGTTVRADYLIDRFRIRYQFGGGWTCTCSDFAAHDACKHTREAAGRRAAQAQIAEYIRNGTNESFALHKRAHGR